MLRLYSDVAPLTPPMIHLLLIDKDYKRITLSKIKALHKVYLTLYV